MNLVFLGYFVVLTDLADLVDLSDRLDLKNTKYLDLLQRAWGRKTFQSCLVSKYSIAYFQTIKTR